MRSALKDFPLASSTHAGHAVSRLLKPKDDTQKDGPKDALKTVADLGLPEGYERVLERWQEQTKQHAENLAEAEKECDFAEPDLSRCAVLSATTRGPLAIGLGNASPYEVGLTLHHTYGVPYLPGSALKGLARRAALKNGMRKSDEAFKDLFGDTGAAGYVTFWDGWLGADTQRPLQLDTITVHHPDYYQNGTDWPTDFDDPIPVPFLSVRPGVTFHLALTGPGAWVGVAARLLEDGLTHLGLGGKTNAGYGGFTVERKKSESELEAEKQRIREAEELKVHQGNLEKYQAQIDGLKPNNAASVVNNLIDQTKALPAGLRREVLQTLLTALGANDRLKREYALLGKVKKALENTP